MTADLVIRHVERPAPPWRTATTRTECGLPTTGHPVITRTEFEHLVRTLGEQRASMQLCMTCWHTASRWPDWATDPVQVVRRETSGNSTFRHDTDPTFLNELRALAALVDTHRDEFDGYLAGLADTASLATARTRHRRSTRTRGAR